MECARIRNTPAVVPKPNEGAEDVAVPPVVPPIPAPPNGLGFGPSPLVLPEPPNVVKVDVDDAPEVAGPPLNRPPGLLAGVFETPPPKTLDELVAVVPLPNSPPLGAPEVVVAVPKREGVALVDAGAAPNKGLLGVLLLVFC